MKGIRYFIKVLRLMSTVSDWSEKALEDGKVSMTELAQLGEEMCAILGIKAEFEIPEE